MIQLHYFPGNASFAPHVLLRELALPFELIPVDRANNAQKGAGYLKLNPAGRIPTFVDGDLVLFETAAICLHLCDSQPDAGLAPKPATPERAHFYKWLMFFATTIQPDVLMYYYPDRYTTDPNGGAAIKQAAARRLMGWFDIVEAGLGDGPYFMGDDYSLLDIYLLMLARWGRPLANPPRDMAKIGAIARRILERPAVCAAIDAEGITGDFLT